jgi:hypothetical protein
LDGACRKSVLARAGKRLVTSPRPTGIVA